MKKKPCGKCGGTGKIPKPISLSKMGEVDCDVCDGTGYLAPDYEGEVIKRLDKIIKLMKGKA